MIIGFLFGVASKDMLKGIHKPALPVYEMQDAADLDLLQLVEKRMIQQFTLIGITQRPARVTSISNDRKVPILTSGDSTVDLSDTALKLFFQFREMLPNRLLEKLKPVSAISFSLSFHWPSSTRSSSKLRKRTLSRQKTSPASRPWRSCL